MILDKQKLLVRTVTVGLSLPKRQQSEWKEKIKAASVAAKDIQQSLMKDGWAVQSTRVATNPFEEYLDLDDEQQLQDQLQILAQIAKSEDLYISLGPAKTPEQVSLVPTLLQASDRFFVSAAVPRLQCPTSLPMITAIAHLYLTLSRINQGELNLNFTASAFPVPHIPFFPAAFHTSTTSQMSVSVALQSAACLARLAAHPPPTPPSGGDPIVGSPPLQPTSGAGGHTQPPSGAGHPPLDGPYHAIQQGLTTLLQPLEATLAAAAHRLNLSYEGIDTSLNPGLGEDQSVIHIFESLGASPGLPGAVGAASQLTAALKSVAVKRVGYCGLMLPVLEDDGLSGLVRERQLRVSNLLLYSTVCGVGLDTVPVAGDVEVGKLAACLTDLTALAYQHRKPLSMRVFPAPGVGVGGRVDFNHEHLCESFVMDLDC